MNDILQQQFWSAHSELSVAAKVRVIALLNSTLATTVDLRMQIKQAQYNVVMGSNYEPLQELFSDMATQLEEYIDIFAERIKALGGLALVTARVAAQLSVLPEYPQHILEDVDHVTALIQRLKLWSRLLRQGSMQAAEWEDANTSQLYMEVWQIAEQQLWLLSAHLQATLAPNDTSAAVVIGAHGAMN